MTREELEEIRKLVGPENLAGMKHTLSCKKCGETRTFTGTMDADYVINEGNAFIEKHNEECEAKP